MPIFDFQCNSCSHQFEKLVFKSDEPTPACVSCSSDDVTKLVSAPGFRLSGSGWYETDFKTGKKKNLTGNKEGSSDTAQ